MVVTPDFERCWYFPANLFALICKVWHFQAFKGLQTESHQSYPSIAGIPFLSDQLLSAQVWDKGLCCCCCRGSTCPHSGMFDTITGSSRVPHIMWVIYNLHVNATLQRALTLQGHTALVESLGAWTNVNTVGQRSYSFYTTRKFDMNGIVPVLQARCTYWNTDNLKWKVMCHCFLPCIQIFLYDKNAMEI